MNFGRKNQHCAMEREHVRTPAVAVGFYQRELSFTHGFVDRVAKVADDMDHHPDIDIRYTKITMSLSTHDAGGITANDLELAGQIESLANRG